MRVADRLGKVFVIGLFGLFATAATAEGGSFSAWLEELGEDALAAGISKKTVRAALAQIEEPLPRVVELDRSQPETRLSLEAYLSSRIDDQRVARGRKMMKRYPTWLERIERRYGVQKRFLVALWGIESGYGDNTGRFPVLQSLASLAYDGRRSAYFRGELIEALRIVDAGHVPLSELRGSWAGAMGQCQFMPSSFRRYAVDADRDGRIDIWNSVPDVLGSIANYLKIAGWRDDQTWGRRVRIPANLDLSLTGMETRLTLPRWQNLGVRRDNDLPLPRRNLEASMIVPDGPQGPAYLVYGNFRRLLAWNRSLSFAVAVGSLSDRLTRNR